VSLLDDMDLNSPQSPGSPEPPRPRNLSKVGLVVSLVVVAGLVAALWVYRANQSHRAAPVPQTPVPARAEQAPTPLGGAESTRPLPALGELDQFIRDAVSQISTASAVAIWLGTDHLAEQFTSIVQGVADGRAPMRQLARLRPAKPFAVLERGGRTIIDAASYRRYDSIAEAVASFDPLACSRLYGTLKPRLREAYSALGIPDSTLDAAVERAVVALLETPVGSGEVAVEPRGALYAFADPRVEALTPAQKLLLRTGPDNARRIQARLREIGVALGIPPERLPQ
jgi:Protein of unknown function (DUF3014)